MTMTMIQCLGLSLRGHGPHASYEPTGQCLFKTNGLKDKLRRLGCRCATQLSTGSRCCVHDQGLTETTDSDCIVCACPLGLRSPPVVAKLKPTGSLVVEQTPPEPRKSQKRNVKNTKQECVQFG